MNYDVVFFPRAELEVTKAFQWYESKTQGLGGKFIRHLDVEIERIKKYPLQARSGKNDFRELPVESFPYIIIFSTRKDKIIVHSIFHTSRNPDKKP